MFEPNLTDVVDPWLAASPGAPPAPTMDAPVSSAPIATATPTVSEVGGRIAAEAAAAAAGAAFGHLAEAPDPAAEAKKKLDGLDALTPADKATALGAMKPEEVAELVKHVPPEERARLVELAKASPNVDDKMAFFMAGQEAKVNADASADLDPDMDPDVAAKMKERREAIAASTLEEMQREQEHLKAKGAALTPDEVNEMIARKTREHDLEMTYNVNLTADEHVRTDGALAGKRVVWTEEELKVMESAFSKSPAMQHGDNVHLETFHRSEYIGDGIHADHDPNTKTIRMADLSLRDEATRTIDPSGKPGMAIDVEKDFDPELRSDRRTLMEWVALHELGHNVHDFHEPEAYQKYKKGMLIHDDLSKEQLDARVPEEVSKDLDHGAKEIEHNGYVYVKVKDGYKCFPRAVFDDPPDHQGNWPNPDPQEYFAQHYNQAILAPEATADEYLDRPAEQERQAREKLRIAQEERQKLADAGQDTSDIDRRIEHLEVRRQHATAKKRVWEKSYHTMRNDVFHTNEAEHEARERLIDAGLDTAEFDERAARLSTPDQITKLEEELLARDAATP